MIQKETWPFFIENRQSAWSGLEQYVVPIVKKFNLKTNLALDIGVDTGYSTHILSKIFKKVIGVDGFLSDPHIKHEQGDSFYYRIKKSFENTNVDLYRMLYQEFIKNNNETYDLIHIDIIHYYKETYECAEWAIMHSNVVLLHDTISFPEINKVCIDISKLHNVGYYNIPEYKGLGILYKI
jgi:hypothetical protein